MANGRKERVVIGCVTFETVKVADPVKYYDATKVHLIHYIRDDLNASRTRVYHEFYDRVVDMISSELPNAEITEHNEVVSDFSAMLRTVLGIIDSEKKNGECDIYVNISAGTSEYAAAATIASMMSDNVKPFTVGSSSFTISGDEEIRRVYYVDNAPVGLTSGTREPKMLPFYAIDRPPEHLVRGLRVLDDEIVRGNSTSSTKIVPKLIEEGIWLRDVKADKNGEKQSFAVNYHRDFMNEWIELRWVEKDKLRRKDVITEKGRNVLNTFYSYL